MIRICVGMIFLMEQKHAG